MRRAILHLGVNKTGTSSLQDFLAKNPERLAAAGFRYPAAGRSGAAHHETAYALMRRDRDALARLRAAILAETGPREHLVLSSEAFMQVRDVALVAELFEGFRISLLIYVREHAAHLASWYQQDIQMSAVSSSFSDYARLNHRPYSDRLEPWRQVFGRGRIEAALYDRASLRDGDIVADAMHRLGIEGWQDWQRTPWENNPSVTGNLLFFKKICNVFGGEGLGEVTEEIEDLSKLRPHFRGKLHVAAEDTTDIAWRTTADRKRMRELYGVELPVAEGALPGQRMPDRSSLVEDWEAVHAAAAGRGLRFARLLADFRIVRTPADAVEES